MSDTLKLTLMIVTIAALLVTNVLSFMYLTGTLKEDTLTTSQVDEMSQQDVQSQTFPAVIFLAQSLFASEDRINSRADVSPEEMFVASIQASVPAVYQHSSDSSELQTLQPLTFLYSTRNNVRVSVVLEILENTTALALKKVKGNETSSVQLSQTLQPEQLLGGPLAVDLSSERLAFAYIRPSADNSSDPRDLSQREVGVFSSSGEQLARYSERWGPLWVAEEELLMLSPEGVVLVNLATNTEVLVLQSTLTSSASLIKYREGFWVVSDDRSVLSIKQMGGNYEIDESSTLLLPDSSEIVSTAFDPARGWLLVATSEPQGNSFVSVLYAFDNLQTAPVMQKVISGIVAPSVQLVPLYN